MYMYIIFYKCVCIYIYIHYVASNIYAAMSNSIDS